MKKKPDLISQEHVPDHLRGNRGYFSQWVGKTIFSFFGWSLNGRIPNEERILIIAAPHTSNWDFILGMLVIIGLNAKIKWIGKHSMFKPGVKWFFKWLGGIPVNRENPASLIKNVTDIVERQKGLMIGMAPEGSRQKVDKWKTGFLRIAELTQAKILFFAIDAPSKCILIGDLFIPTGNIEEDMKFVKNYFSAFKGINPEQF